MEKLCGFCDELEYGFRVGGVNSSSRVIRETEHFVVLPALGQIVEGHVLIIPKKHYFGLGRTPREFYQELEQLQHDVKADITKRYEQPVFFEHGSVSQTQKAGCCLDHAHLVVVPCSETLEHAISKEFPRREVQTYEACAESVRKGQPYIFLEESDGRRMLFEVSDTIPSQYMRQVIAVKLRKPERWDWRAIQDDLGTLWRTYETLRAR